MRVGFALGQHRPDRHRRKPGEIAQRAEALAYDSLWTPASGRDAGPGPPAPAEAPAITA